MGLLCPAVRHRSSGLCPYVHPRPVLCFCPSHAPNQSTSLGSPNTPLSPCPLQALAHRVEGNYPEKMRPDPTRPPQFPSRWPAWVSWKGQHFPNAHTLRIATDRG